MVNGLNYQVYQDLEILDSGMEDKEIRLQDLVVYGLEDKEEKLIKVDCHRKVVVVLLGKYLQMMCYELEVDKRIEYHEVGIVHDLVVELQDTFDERNKGKRNNNKKKKVFCFSQVLLYQPLLCNLLLDAWHKPATLRSEIKTIATNKKILALF